MNECENALNGVCYYDTKIFVFICTKLYSDVWRDECNYWLALWCDI